jgi:ectoine hydroxylase-related dioxygenase (phytanoyl-CoA dioxygenase family)
MTSPVAMLETESRAWVRGALGPADLEALDRACTMGGAPGMRLAIDEGIAAALAPVGRLAQSFLTGARVVRLVAFNKSEAANWSLPWHQDRVIAVREHAEVPGFANWTRKAGVWHVEPPIGFLEGMIFARVHLDPATEDNGCLELACGSHSRGRVADADAADVAGACPREVCLAARGDVLFAKALTLHRSRASRNTADRRALRIDFAAGSLPAPLEWEFTT